MVFEKFYIADKNGKSNCVVRSLCKVLNREYDDVYNDLMKIAQKLKSHSFNDVEVFEKYMKDNNISKIEFKKDLKIKDIRLDKKTYVILCYDKEGYYHMIPIINNVIYDKNDDCMNLYVLAVYEKK